MTSFFIAKTLASSNKIFFVSANFAVQQTSFLPLTMTFFFSSCRSGVRRNKSLAPQSMQEIYSHSKFALVKMSAGALIDLQASLPKRSLGPQDTQSEAVSSGYLKRRIRVAEKATHETQKSQVCVHPDANSAANFGANARSIVKIEILHQHKRALCHLIKG